VCCATCLLTCECASVGCAKTVSGNGEGQVWSMCAIESGREGLDQGNRGRRTDRCMAHIGHRKTKSTWVCGGDGVDYVKDKVGPNHSDVSRALGGPLYREHGGRTHVYIN